MVAISLFLALRVIFGVLLAADMWLCDPHGLCSTQHDYVGIGDRPWPAAQPVKRHYPGWWGHDKAGLSKATKHEPCKLGDKNWGNDCR
jgi:hypothetical protein